MYSIYPHFVMSEKIVLLAYIACCARECQQRSHNIRSVAKYIPSLVSEPDIVD